MSTEATSAQLIMQLYELRREQTMRDARNWFVSFFPESADEVIKTMVDSKTSAYYRMVSTYWDMAASFVVHGAIDEEMFLDSNGECIIVFAKIQPYLEQLRTTLGNPKYLKNLEKLIMKHKDAGQMLADRREQMKIWMQARAELTKQTAV